jgi:hypothetical protein
MEKRNRENPWISWAIWDGPPTFDAEPTVLHLLGAHGQRPVVKTNSTKA